MPQATDLTIKNAAAVDKSFKLLAPAAGYGGVAEWALKEGAISSVFPRVTALARHGQGNSGNGRSASKIVQFKVRVPSSFTDTVTGLTNVQSAFETNVTVSIPADFPESLKDDAVAYTTNFLSHALAKSMMKEGSPAS